MKNDYSLNLKLVKISKSKLNSRNIILRVTLIVPKALVSMLKEKLCIGNKKEGNANFITKFQVNESWLKQEEF